MTRPRPARTANISIELMAMEWLVPRDGVMHPAEDDPAADGANDAAPEDEIDSTANRQIDARLPQVVGAGGEGGCRRDADETVE